MKNMKVSEILNEIADMLEMKGIEYKPRAYKKAARTIRSLSSARICTQQWQWIKFSARYYAKCPKCKYKWNNTPEGFMPLKEEPIIEEETVELEEE